MPLPNVEIVEVLERSKQGITRPFICRGDDDEVYFVKGAATTRRGLVAELISARLAEFHDVPLAPWKLASIDSRLIQLDRPRLAELGPGIAFASARVNGVEYSRAHMDNTPSHLRQGVLLFDWWIRNGDRNLTRYGGNPNLIWRTDAGQLAVIDHNLAFDSTLTFADLLGNHVFADDAPSAFGDFDVRQQFTERVNLALEAWDAICGDIPASWMFVDEEETIPVDFSLNEWKQALERPTGDDFWNIGQ